MTPGGETEASLGRAAGLLLVLVVLLVTASAFGREPSAGAEAEDGLGRVEGDIERSRVRAVLEERGLRATEPGDRTICALHVVAQDIFLPGDPFPRFLNAFHRTTREGTIRAALSFAEGDRWDELLVEASERELRGRLLYSLVAIVAVEHASDPACIGVLVLTQDQWSLQLGWDVTLAGNALTDVFVSMRETNFLGRNVTLGMDLNRSQGDFALGPSVFVPSVGDRRLRVQARGQLILDHGGTPEGTRSSFRLEQPIRSVADRHGWVVGVDHVHRLDRLWLDGTLRETTVEVDGTSWTFPERWRRTSLSGFGLRRWGIGERWRHTVSVGPWFRWTDRALLERDIDGIPLPAVEAFREERLPEDERSVGPLVQWQLVESRFLRMRNVNSFGTTESFRLGLLVAASAEHAEPLLGSRVRTLRPAASVGYRVRLGPDAWVLPEALTSVRLERGAENRSFTLSLRGVSPERLCGRLHLHVRQRLNGRTRSGVVEILGADTVLRGYPQGWVRARDVGVARVEWRSRPLRLFDSSLGGVLFSDSAWARGGDLTADWSAWSAAGAGFRLRVPQFMATVFAMDLGFPLHDGRRVEVGRSGVRIPAPLLSAHVGQAF
ncbi:MAG: hypothetical protein EA398_05300 [Deltaproteobacteria bacterium]|nr:MAG: hypothetical protein EA398_05300 [Deltaproteobacteria bacterium]